MSAMRLALAVAGYPQNDRDDCIGYRSNRLGYDVESAVSRSSAANHRVYDVVNDGEPRPHARSGSPGRPARQERQLARALKTLAKNSRGFETGANRGQRSISKETTFQQ
jgi:hypothetical protein